MDLLSSLESSQRLDLDGLVYLRGYALPNQTQLLDDLHAVISAAPLRQMMTPMGFAMSVATTSCGALGWVSDQQGYRYSPIDPIRQAPWPAMPESFFVLANTAANIAGYTDFAPDACLINQYQIGTKMGLHQDKNERDFTQPIVSVSLGIAARFQFGGKKRTDKPTQLRLEHGDVIVWGGDARLNYHGIMTMQSGCHAILGNTRVNLTFRKAG
ncbi:alkylated DNA repair protein [Methylophilaceae bacterium 11]|jgi:alkylated DNA repair protein (DNA oxidative demethylase)|uniref:DNA oxidative demethylase AlkB n=1 Tax=Methylotenera sp. N17 TaxID=1502761 RepID=UPI00044B57A3|nr:DNA oxidative demethylase AlkB [Methylotenera sp. N17]EUJ11726.1 alkylated DNA repair protein [Methylophilaceae bacterium 11]